MNWKKNRLWMRYYSAIKEEAIGKYYNMDEYQKYAESKKSRWKIYIL